MVAQFRRPEVGNQAAGCDATRCVCGLSGGPSLSLPGFWCPRQCLASLEPLLSSSSCGVLCAYLGFKYHDLERPGEEMVCLWLSWNHNDKITLYGLSNPWKQVTVEDSNWSKLEKFNLWDQGGGSKWNLGLIKRTKKEQPNFWVYKYFYFSIMPLQIIFERSQCTSK